MNCHKNSKKKQGTHSHSPLKLILHMIICCGLPISIFAFLPIITKYSPNTGNIIEKIVPFLCPLMMISVMILMMLDSNKNNNCCNNEHNNDSNRNILNLDDTRK